MIKKIFIITSLFTLFAVIGFSFCVNAQTVVSGSATIENPLGTGKTITVLIADILKIIAQFGAIVCVFFIIYAGFLFIKAQGDPAELTKAKSVLLWSVVGAAVLLGASVIADLIRGTVNSVLGSSI